MNHATFKCTEPRQILNQKYIKAFSIENAIHLLRKRQKKTKLSEFLKTKCLFGRTVKIFWDSLTKSDHKLKKYLMLLSQLKVLSKQNTGH